MDSMIAFTRAVVMGVPPVTRPQVNIDGLFKHNKRACLVPLVNGGYMELEDDACLEIFYTLADKYGMPECDDVFYALESLMERGRADAHQNAL